MSNIRELSQLASLIHVNDETKNVGIATTTPNEKLSVNGNVSVSGIVTASTFYGDGSNLTGISASGGELYWSSTIVGIHTLSNVGVGTTNPTSKLSVVGNVNVSGIVTALDFNSTSDIKFKENIKVINNVIDKIISISGVTFEWKDNSQVSAGVIAQDVEKVFPEIVKTNDDKKTVNYNGLIALLIEVVKEQQKQINILSEKVDNLEK